MILHHAGDANDPPVRVPHTLKLAKQRPFALVVCAVRADDREVIELGDALAQRPQRGVQLTSRVATDTLTEVIEAKSLVDHHGVVTLVISTEPGHVGRASLIARIVFWRRGVTVVPSPSAPGGYRSPLRRTCLDAARAVIYRLTGRVVMV